MAVSTRMMATLRALLVTVVLVALLGGCAPISPATPTASSVAAVGTVPTTSSGGGATPSAATAPASPTSTPTAERPRATAVSTASAAAGSPSASRATPSATATLPPASAPAAGATARILTASGHEVIVMLEVADTPASRAIGLSRRSSLAADGGMLFVFPSDGLAPFWMKDTWIPLSIAFIASDGAIVDIQDMQPMTEDLHSPPRPYRYALEVNQGFFEKNGVRPDDRVEIRLGGT